MRIKEYIDLAGCGYDRRVAGALLEEITTVPNMWGGLSGIADEEMRFQGGY